MNERLRELAEQAAKFSAIMALPTGESGDKLFAEKFAQLIVRQCCDIANRRLQHNNPNDCLLALEFKEHFGV